jgi:hypothetical protein
MHKVIPAQQAVLVKVLVLALVVRVVGLYLAVGLEAYKPQRRARVTLMELRRVRMVEEEVVQYHLQPQQALLLQQVALVRVALLLLRSFIDESTYLIS